MATLQADRWRALYHELDVAGDGDGRLSRDEVSQRLSELDAPEREADSILRALFILFLPVYVLFLAVSCINQVRDLPPSPLISR